MRCIEREEFKKLCTRKFVRQRYVISRVNGFRLYRGASTHKHLLTTCDVLDSGRYQFLWDT